MSVRIMHTVNYVTQTIAGSVKHFSLVVILRIAFHVVCAVLLPSETSVSTPSMISMP